MNKRDAKQEASHVTTLLIQQYLDAGQPFHDCLDRLTPGHDRIGLAHGDCLDCERLYSAYRLLIGELCRRSAAKA